MYGDFNHTVKPSLHIYFFLQRRDAERNRDGNRDKAGTRDCDTDGRELGGGAMEEEIGWERWG